MSILIKNGLVYDGSERPFIKTDVFVQGNRIAKIDDVGNLRADIVINAEGSPVTPGIIDINTDSDHHLSLITDPGQEDFLKQGVTTILGGNCGKSLAPFYGKNTRDLIQSWNVASDVNWSWSSVADFLDSLKKIKLGVNFGTLLGYSTLRSAFSNDTKDLTENEIESLRSSIGRGLKEGAFGLSFEAEDIAGRPLQEMEFMAALKTLEQEKGVASFHLGRIKEINSFISKLVKISENISLNLEINHFQPTKDLEEEYIKAKEAIENLSAKININFDVFPFTKTAVSIEELFPSWLRPLKGKELSEVINLPSNRKRIVNEAGRFKGEDIEIGQLPKNIDFFEGRTLREFANYYGINKNIEALIKLCSITEGRAILFIDNVSGKTLESFIASPRSIIASNGVSFKEKSFKHERNTKTFTDFLAKTKGDNGLFLEKAVAKITSTPAKKYNISERGSIKEGYFADIVIWQNDKPREVIINGSLSIQNFGLTGKKGGVPIRKMQN